MLNIIIDEKKNNKFFIQFHNIVRGFIGGLCLYVKNLI